MEEAETLRAQLLQCQAENKKMRAQLHGLITLVKKAWTGDHSAAIDVAFIVGVSPPSLEISSVTDELVAVPKPPAVNNWLRLTVGLLNKEYKDRKMTTKARQLMYLREREAYIDDQMPAGHAEHREKSKLDRRVEWATSLRDIVEKENEKRMSLRKGLEKHEQFEQTVVVKSRGRNGSFRETTSSNAKVRRNRKIPDANLGDCLVVNPRSQGKTTVTKSSSSKTRPKSAGWVVNIRKGQASSTVGRKRPESAQIQGKVHLRVGNGKYGESRIERQLDETERNIEVTIGLLQERLGIDRKERV